MKTQEQINLDNTIAAIWSSTDKAERRELRASLPALEKAAEKANKKQALALLPNLPAGKSTRSGEGYKFALEAIIREGACIKVGHNTGSGRYSGSVEYTSDTTAWLNANGYVYETGNDAPKGGRAGAWVRVIGRNA